MTLFDRTAGSIGTQLPFLRRIHIPENLKPLLLAVAVGLAAGIGAVIFTEMVDGFHALFFGEIGGALIDMAGDWMVIWVPVLAAIPIAVLVERYAREARGGGVPEVMQAVETHGGRIRPRVAAARALASALTIGAGGSAGREGPIVQIGASLASTLGRALQQPPDMVVLMVAAGAAGGISAIFNAPIAGVFFALEIILRRFNVRNFTLVVVSSVVANMVAIAFEGDHPGIAIPPYALESELELGLYAMLGVAAAVVGIFWVRILYLIDDIFSIIPASAYLKILVAMLAIGALGFWHSELFGTGFPVIELAAIDGIATGTLAILLLLKILATSVTLGGGASGGVFAPSLFIGAMLGGLMGNAFIEIAPDSVAPPGAYAVVGMAAVFAASARAPITALFIVFELTRDYSLILPLMIGVAIATALAQIITRDTIYSIRLKRIGILIHEEAAQPNQPNMDQITVSEAMRINVSLVGADLPLSALASAMARTHVDVLAVTDDQNRFRGLISATDLTAALERSEENLTAKDLAVLHPIHVFPDQTLRAVITTLVENDISQAPVVARWDERRLLGMISQRDVLREFAATTTARGAPAPSSHIQRLVGAIHVELAITAGSPLVGIELKDLHLPQEAVIATIHRAGVVVIPRGTVHLEADDVLTVITEPAVEPTVRRLLSGTEAVLGDPSASRDDES